MPEMVVVSVLQEKEAVFHSVAWCSSLPCTALQVFWTRTISLFHRWINIYLWSFSDWFPCCSLAASAENMHGSSPSVSTSRCVGWVPCVTWRMSFLLCLSHVAPRESHPCWCGTTVGVVWILWHLFALSLVLQTCLFLPFGLLWGWVVMWWYLCQGWLCSLIPAVQEGLGRSPARSAVPLTVGEIDEQVSPLKCGAEMDSVLLHVRSSAFKPMGVG